MGIWSLSWEDPWRRAWQPTPVFLIEESHGLKSLAGYSTWGCKESDMAEHTWINTFTNTFISILFSWLKWKINEGEKHYRITMTLRPQDFLYLRTNAKNTETFVSLKFQYFPHLRTRQCTVITVNAPPTPSSAPVPSTCQRWPSANKYLWQTLPFLSQGFFWEVIPLG